MLSPEIRVQGSVRPRVRCLGGRAVPGKCVLAADFPPRAIGRQRRLGGSCCCCLTKPNNGTCLREIVSGAASKLWLTEVNAPQSSQGDKPLSSDVAPVSGPTLSKASSVAQQNETQLRRGRRLTVIGRNRSSEKEFISVVEVGVLQGVERALGDVQRGVCSKICSRSQVGR